MRYKTVPFPKHEQTYRLKRLLVILVASVYSMWCVFADNVIRLNEVTNNGINMYVYKPKWHLFKKAIIINC